MTQRADEGASHIETVKELLEGLDPKNAALWRKNWSELISPSLKEVGCETNLHLACKEAVARGDEASLDDWFKKLSVMQIRDVDPKRVEWKSYLPEGRRKWEGNVAMGVVAAAMTALAAKAPASVEVFNWAWRASVGLSGCQTDLPGDLDAAYNKFKSETNAWTSGNVITAIFNGLSGRVVLSPENEKVNLPLSQAEDLVKWYTGERIDVDQPHRWTALVIEGAGASKKGACATLNLEAVPDGRGEIYAEPLSFAFVYREDNFNQSLDNAKETMKYLGWWDGNRDVRWFLTRKGTNRFASLEGGSLGGLFAAGLWHLLSGELRDINVTVCAQIDKNGKLHPVVDDDIDMKLKKAQENGVSCVVVAPDQKWKLDYPPHFVVKADAFANLETHTHEAFQARRVSGSP